MTSQYDVMGMDDRGIASDNHGIATDHGMTVGNDGMATGDYAMTMDASRASPWKTFELPLIATTFSWLTTDHHAIDRIFSRMTIEFPYHRHSMTKDEHGMAMYERGIAVGNHGITTGVDDIAPDDLGNAIDNELWHRRG